MLEIKLRPKRSKNKSYFFGFPQNFPTCSIPVGEVTPKVPRFASLPARNGGYITKKKKTLKETLCADRFHKRQSLQNTLPIMHYKQCVRKPSFGQWLVPPLRNAECGSVCVLQQLFECLMTLWLCGELSYINRRSNVSRYLYRSTKH